MMESVRAGSRDRAPGTQIGIACELRWKPGGAVPELTMDGGPRIRAGLGDPGFSGLYHPASCNPLPAARAGPLTDGAASEQRQIDLICIPQLTSFREKIAAPIGGYFRGNPKPDAHGK
jgi:hypothetical protein